MKKIATFTVRGLLADGTEVWYTGRAGDGFISHAKAEAFEYRSLDAARTKALALNHMTALHGVRFVGIHFTGDAAGVHLDYQGGR